MPCAFPVRQGGMSALLWAVKCKSVSKNMKANVVSELIAAKADVDRKDKVRQQLEALSFANIFELFLTPLLTGRDDTAQCSYGTRRSWRDPSPLARRRRLHFHRRGSNCSCLHLGSTRTSLTPFLSGLRFGRCMFVIRRRPQIQRNEWSQRKCP